MAAGGRCVDLMAREWMSVDYFGRKESFLAKTLEVFREKGHGWSIYSSKTFWVHKELRYVMPLYECALLDEGHL